MKSLHDMQNAEIQALIASHGQMRAFVVPRNRILLICLYYGVIQCTERSNLLHQNDLDGKPDQNNHDDESVHVIGQESSSESPEVGIDGNSKL
jgi:hypothetical protein